MSKATQGWKWKNALEVTLCNSAKRGGFFIYLVENPTWKKKVGDKNLTPLQEIYKWCDKINICSTHEKKCNIQCCNISPAQVRWYLVSNLQSVGLSCWSRALLVRSNPHPRALSKAGELAQSCQLAVTMELCLFFPGAHGSSSTTDLLCVWIRHGFIRSTALPG